MCDNDRLNELFGEVTLEYIHKNHMGLNRFTGRIQDLAAKYHQLWVNRNSLFVNAYQIYIKRKLSVKLRRKYEHISSIISQDPEYNRRCEIIAQRIGDESECKQICEEYISIMFAKTAVLMHRLLSTISSNDQVNRLPSVIDLSFRKSIPEHVETETYILDRRLQSILNATSFLDRDHEPEYTKRYFSVREQSEEFWNDIIKLRVVLTEYCSFEINRELYRLFMKPVIPKSQQMKLHTIMIQANCKIKDLLTTRDSVLSCLEIRKEFINQYNHISLISS